MSHCLKNWGIVRSNEKLDVKSDNLRTCVSEKYLSGWSALSDMSDWVGWSSGWSDCNAVGLKRSRQKQSEQISSDSVLPLLNFQIKY